jgi:hypothetical protein
MIDALADNIHTLMQRGNSFTPDPNIMSQEELNHLLDLVWDMVDLAANQDEFEADRISRSMGVAFSQSTMDAADLSCMTNCILTNVTTRMRKKRNNAPGK